MERGTKKISGVLKVSEDVIYTITQLAVSEIEGVASIAPDKKNIKRFIINNENTDAISVKFIGDVVEISIGILVKNGYKVVSIAEKIQEKVKTSVQSMTGVTVSKVNVKIVGVNFDKE